MIVSEITLYDLLRAKLGDKEASAFLGILESKVDKKFEEAKSVLATKEDLANSKADIIKWMFIFWIGQMASTVAIVKLFM